MNLSDTTHIQAVSNNVLKNNANLKSLDGDINIEAGQQVYLAPNKSIRADGDITIHSKEKLTIAGKSGTQGAPSAQTSSLIAKGEVKLIAGEADIQGAFISAGKNLGLTTTQGKLNIGSVRTTFRDYLPNQKVAELRRNIQKLEKQIAETRKTNPHDKRLAAWNNEKGRLEFYIQAINKRVKGHLPRGYEYKQATLTGQNITLLSAQGIKINGSDILAEKTLNIKAAGLLPKEGTNAQSSILIEGVSDHYEIGQSRFKSHYDVSTLNKPSIIQGKQGVNIHAPYENPNARIIVRGSQIDALAGTINIKAYGDVLLENGLNDSYTFWKETNDRGGVAGFLGGTKSHSDRNHLIMPAPTELSAGKGIHIEAGRNIDAYSTRFYAPKGKINLIAGEELNLYAVEGKHHHHHETNKTTRFVGIKIKNKDYKKEELTHTKLPVKVIANGVNTRSGWDTVLEGTEFQTMLEKADIRAGVGDKARADAKIILQGIVTHVHTEENSKSNSTVWQSMAGKGSTVETLSLPTFEGPQPPVLSAPGGFIVDIPKGNFKTEIEKLVKQPQYAYLKQLQVSKDVKWNEIQLAYDSWNYKQEGLTGAGAAIIALALAVATGGAGAGVGATIIGAAQGTAAAAMANTAFVSLVTQASIATINNKGNPRKTLKELGSSRTVKNLATAVITAGVANKIGASSALNQVSDKQWVNDLTVNLATAGSEAAVSTAINGGSLKDNLEASILNALIKTGHGAAASQIKTINGEAWYRNVAHKIAHAVAGCAAAAAGKNKCQDGAIGAAVGEIVGEALVNNTDFSGMTPEQIAKEKAKIVDYAKLAAGTVVGVTGGDVNAAAQTAQTAIENNLFGGSYGSYKAKQDTEKQFKQTCGSMSVDACFSKHGSEIRIEGMVGYIFQANGGMSFLWIPGHAKLYKADMAFGLGYGGKLKFDQVNAAKELGISSSDLDIINIVKGSEPRSHTLAVSNRIEAEARFWGLGGGFHTEAGVEGKTNGKGDTKFFVNGGGNLGFKSGSVGGGALIKWDAFKFRWQR
uniref:DUF637 domain-containing protein n=1 Tax=Neisseria wadsworthii TaxID=607711 RepID=UPI001F2A0E0C|nr:DUF637 domain-containing protein [Neisseria wadsworthii]